MIKKSLTIFLIVFSIIFFSCDYKNNANKIYGLWLVKKVQIGKDKMTPISRWMQFNSDSTQTSGNGWLQHSVGSWSIKNNKLSIKNANGIEDEFEPFEIKIENSTMTWSRLENDQNVIIFLEKINTIPTSEGNKLMGLWKLNSINNLDKNSTLQYKTTLYLSWDNRYIKEKEGNSKEYGIYKIHGHKPEIQMINYGDNPKFTFYNFSIKDTILTLKTSTNKEEFLYSRIHKFLK